VPVAAVVAVVVCGSQTYPLLLRTIQLLLEVEVVGRLALAIMDKTVHLPI
jgi:hypothetical protein